MPQAPRRPQPAAPGQGVPTKQAVRGPLHAVPCPHCGRPNDFRGFAPSGGLGWGDYGLEPGTVVDCDHCKRKSQIVHVDKVTLVSLRQHNK